MRAQEVNLKELFSNSHFEVAEYQRPYAWGEKNWKDLYKDIKTSVKNNEPHYFGTISLKRNENKHYEIIDGQQRLTTLYLFALALYRVLTERNLWKDEREKLRFEIYFLRDEDLKLSLGNLNREFFKGFVESVLNASSGEERELPEADLDTNRKLKGAYEYFYNELSSKLDDKILQGILNFLQSDRVILVKFEVSDDLLAVKTFEILNDRGLPLNYTDKLKSHLFFLIKRELLNLDTNFINRGFAQFFQNFNRIKTLGKELRVNYIDRQLSEDDILVYLYHYLFRWATERYNIGSEVAYEYNIYREGIWNKFLTLFDKLKQDKNQLEEFIKELLTDLVGLSKSLLDILQRAAEKESNELFKVVALLEPNVRTWHLLVTSNYRGFLTQELLRLIETMDVRIYKVRGTDPRRGLYLNVISTLKSLEAFPLAEFKDFLQEFGNDADFEHYLKGSMYNNPATKYMLWELNSTTYLKKVAKKFGINLHGRHYNFDDIDKELYYRLEEEHILPQTLNTDFRNFGFLSEADYREYINKLGNLTVIERSLNKKDCSNKIPAEKIEPCYSNSKLPYNRRFLTRLLTKRKFDKGTLEALTDALIEVLKERFSI